MEKKVRTPDTLEQQGWIRGTWGTAEKHREAKFYSITRGGRAALTRETRHWRMLSGLVEKPLTVGES